ncbi:hypothetical protein TorRG33x02_175400 [Trema orientale]|uniref:Uncharacterized protein n=1 Tax=Trema orientale TaxID=63057 RepID=A0A2P5EMA6_TREOI|nr:hypothetical protein TorRG33x02_175400 [Trema orientale]
MEGSNSASLDQEQPCYDLVTSLRMKLQNFSPLPSECCIYRVPERLRHENAKAYTPKVVSIGPLHYDGERLQAMEEHKMLYLRSFLNRTRISLEDYVQFIKDREEKVRNHYAETFESIGSNQFVEMILVDAAFVIELLWRNHLKEGVEENDRIFNRPWKVVDVRNDMMLLENQLPFFIFEDIFCLAKLKGPPENNFDRVSLIKLTYEFFRFKAYLGEIAEILKKVQSSKIKHFVDFIRRCHLPRELPPKGEIPTLTIPSVTELYQAGVKFEVGSTRSLFDIQFRKGTLVIPHLRIRKSTESFFLNLVAFEQCHSLDCYINDYVFIIDRLVDSSRAVQLLVRRKVIESKLPDNQEVVTSVNNLVRGSILRRKHFYFNELCDNLNDHYNNPWNRWMAAIKHGYFSSPLTIFAVVVATAVFILTFLQTICSCGVQLKKTTPH